MNEDHSQIHAEYCRLTSRDFPLTMGAMYRWEVWKSQGWTRDDLELVVRHVKSLIAKGRRFPESLRFHNLIGNIEMFHEHLAEAHSLARRPKVDKSKASVLRTTGREEVKETPALTAAQIVAGSEALKKLLELRDNL